jgi:glutathione S-transferase
MPEDRSSDAGTPAQGRILKIWGREAALNVQKVLWCADELQLPYERLDAGQHYGVVNTPSYLALNPNGRVPTLEDGHFVLWESNAIVRYLAAQYGIGKLCPLDTMQRADADRWMDWQATTVFYPTFRTYFITITRVSASEHDVKKLEAMRIEIAGKLRILDEHLGRVPYVAGDYLTMGDIPIGTVIDKWMRMPIERPCMKNLESYYARLCSREPFQRRVVGHALNAV